MGVTYYYGRFELVSAPAELVRALQAHYESNREAGAREEFTNGRGMGTPLLITPLIDVAANGTLLRHVQSSLQPVLEEWVGGQALVMQRCHGLREYTRGGALDRHVDWPLSHVRHDAPTPTPVHDGGQSFSALCVWCMHCAVPCAVRCII
jgi:hypothetical protein